MDKSTKHVRFFEQERLHYRRVRIPLGQTYQITLSIETTPEELNTLFNIIDDMNKTTITPTVFNDDAIKQLIVHIQQLLELNCMLPHQAYIQSSTRRFFFHVIDNMKHVLSEQTDEIGTLEQYDAALAMINLELSHINAVNTQAIRSLRTPSEPYDLNLSQLPQSLPEFIRSLNITKPGRLDTWENHFRTLSISILDGYLAKVLASIQQLADDHEIKFVLKRIKRFVKKLSLNHHADHILLDMFSTIATHGNRSPLRSPHETYTHTLTAQMDALLKPDITDFNHEFSLFRRELSKAKHIPYIQLNMLLQSLHAHVLGKNKLPSSPHAAIVQHYLAQRLNRIQHPLPEHLQIRCDHLLRCYHHEDNHPVSRRENYKFHFLTTLLDTIHRYPEKTYAECIRLTENTEQLATIALNNNHNTSLTFFRKHRFKDWMTELLHVEPDYESSTHVQPVM